MAPSPPRAEEEFAIGRAPTGALARPVVAWRPSCQLLHVPGHCLRVSVNSVYSRISTLPTCLRQLLRPLVPRHCLRVSANSSACLRRHCLPTTPARSTPPTCLRQLLLRPLVPRHCLRVSAKNPAQPAQGPRHSPPTTPATPIPRHCLRVSAQLLRLLPNLDSACQPLLLLGLHCLRVSANHSSCSVYTAYVSPPTTPATPIPRHCPCVSTSHSAQPAHVPRRRLPTTPPARVPQHCLLVSANYSACSRTPTLPTCLWPIVPPTLPNLTPHTRPSQLLALGHLYAT